MVKTQHIVTDSHLAFHVLRCSQLMIQNLSLITSIVCNLSVPTDERTFPLQAFQISLYERVTAVTYQHGRISFNNPSLFSRVIKNTEIQKVGFAILHVSTLTKGDEPDVISLMTYLQSNL